VCTATKRPSRENKNRSQGDFGSIVLDKASIPHRTTRAIIGEYMAETVIKLRPARLNQKEVDLSNWFKRCKVMRDKENDK